MPQAYEAGSIFLAYAVLAQGGLSALELLKETNKLSRNQIALIRHTMHTVHAARRIPAGDDAYLQRASAYGIEMKSAILIDDDKLTYTWNRFRTGGVLVIENFSNNPNSIQRLASGFCTTHCLSLLKLYRSEYDRRNCEATDERGKELRIEILAHVEEQALSGYRDTPGGVLYPLFESHSKRAF